MANWVGSQGKDAKKATEGRAPGVLPALTLPRGGGSIRSVGEKFSTSPATGTLSLSVPLLASPGRPGFELGLALNFDSGAGNGQFGLGWRLSTAGIQRSTERRLPRYDDEQDVFVLSGAEDLVPSLVARSGGAYELERFREGPYYGQRYRPRVEGAFARIERWVHGKTGEVHWASVDRNNVRSTYGRSAAARIADPRDPGRVFSWLLEETSNDCGNIVRYAYKVEDGAGVDEARPSEWHRFTSPHAGFAQRYLKRVLYGNQRPGEAADWLFELVSDFGEHDLLLPRPVEERPWKVRADAFSDYRPGFEVRTYRLCRRMLMFHRIPELGAEPWLVGSTDFTYEESPSVTTLRSVTHVGTIRDEAGGYDRETLPPLEFDYTRAEIQGQVRALDDGEHPGTGPSRIAWEDLNSEGIPGVLIAERDALWYRRNLGGGQLAPAVRLPSQPAPLDLATGLQQIVDLEGNGRKSVAELGGPLAGYYERTSEGGWKTFESFRSVPNIDWNDPNLRFIDLDHDGRPDVLITEHEAFVWYPSRGKEGFGPAIEVRKPKDEDKGPAIVFADQDESIFLADMTGDGLVDIVRVRSRAICYWPNLGLWPLRRQSDDGPGPAARCVGSVRCASGSPRRHRWLRDSRPDLRGLRGCRDLLQPGR